MTGIHHASMREQRTVSNMDSRDSIPHSRSDPADLLDTKLSDESSVFSGLVYGRNNIIPPPPPPPPPPKEGRPSKIIIQKGILRAANHTRTTTTTTTTSPKIINVAISSSNGDDDDDDSFSVDRSQRSMMRYMPPMIDSVMSLGNSTVSTSSSGKQNDTLSTAISNDDSTMNNELMKNMKNLHDLFPDGDSNTQMTWGSANDMARPKGTIKLMSSVTFVGDQIEAEGSSELDHQDSELDHHEDSQQSINNCRSDDSDSRIVDLLNDFEKQMDANIEIINDENNDESGDILSDLKDTTVPRRVQLEDAESDDQFLTPHKARKLQRILGKAKDEVEVLKDNSEQYKSEIEQMEEEHKSEIKLIKDRARQQLGELKSFYQGEIDGLAVEKDAAIIEAGRVATRYAQTAKKQQKQVDRLKAAAMVTIKEQVEKARRDAMADKKNEITAKLENELEKVKKESDERVKNEVDNAVSSVTKRITLNHDVLISELRNQIDDLSREQHSMIDLLESVKSKFEQHYPEEMIQLKEKPENFSGSARKLLDSDTSSEKVLKEVIETFSFLLEATEKKAVSAQNQSAMQENEKKPTEVHGGQKHLVLRHRAEIEHLKKERGETFEKLRKVERDFKDVSREKSVLEEKLQRELENHQMELERIRLESKTVLEIEMRRKDLENAMTTGQRELSHHHKVAKEEYRFAASFMNVEKRKELDLQVQALNTEARDPLKKELQYSFSIPTPRSISEDGVGLERSDRQKRTFDSPRSPSLRKATNKQSNTIPRETNQIPSDIGVTDMNKLKSDNNIIIIPATDNKHMCQARDTPVTEFAHGTLSNMDSEEKKQEDELAANHPKKNNFAILRSFKGRNNSTQQNSSQAAEKEIGDKKKETTNIMIRSLRRARNFKKDDSSIRSRRSIDDSISSLKPNSSEDSTLRESRKDSRVGRLLNARQNYPNAETRDESDQIKNYKKTEDSRSAKRGTDTLRMFAEGKQNKQPENNKLQSKSVDSELDSNDEIIIPPPPLPHSSSKYNINGSNNKVQKGLHEEISHVENKDEPFGEITTRLNLKKPPLSTVQELSSMKGSLHSRAYRPPGFASFRDGRFNEETVKKSTSDASSSSPAGSEATTAVTAHTDLSSSNGSVRFTAALKARVRVRKLHI
jgi:hypothetical protein